MRTKIVCVTRNRADVKTFISIFWRQYLLNMYLTLSCVMLLWKAKMIFFYIDLALHYRSSKTTAVLVDQHWDCFENIYLAALKQLQRLRYRFFLWNLQNFKNTCRRRFLLIASLISTWRSYVTIIIAKDTLFMYNLK